jgi:hypothetical protein
MREFKSLFCQRFGCLNEDYEETLFWKCLHRHAIPFALILRKIDPEFFREDFDFIRELGHATSRDEVIGELNRFYGRNVRDQSWTRKHLFIRISGKRVLKIQRQVFACSIGDRQ